MSHSRSTLHQKAGDRRTKHLVRGTVAMLVVLCAATAVSCAPPRSAETSTSSAKPALPGLAWSDSQSATASVVASTANLPSNDPAFRLTFDEEFDGNSINRSRWRTGMPWGDLTTGEAQIYKPSALGVNSGVLTITATKGGTSGQSYTSGAINSDKRWEFLYGYMEARARVPNGTGLWPAIWMQTAGPGQFNEIDMLEVLGQDPSANHVNLHKDSNRWKDGTTYRGPDLSDGFHTYAVDWQPGLVVWYLDGVEVYRSKGYDLNRPMHIITNLTVGGPTSWSGPPNAQTRFPATFDVDYIRVYQRK